MRDKLDLDLESMWKEFELYENPATEKQKAILEAAETLFSEKGFNASPTAEIAKKAGVTERTLFKHFPSKEVLLKRLIFGVIVKVILRIQLKKVRAFTQTPYASAREFILAVGKDRIQNVKKHAPRLRILLLELVQNASFRQQFTKIWKQHIWNDLLKTVEEFQKKGQLRSDLPAAAIVQTAVFTIMGFAASRYLLDLVRTTTPEKDLEVLLDAVLNGVGKKKI
jgi:AcrR family transcriptional regulator